MGFFFIESVRKEIHFLNGFLDRLDKMAFFDSRNLWFFVSEKGSDNPFNIGRGSFWILEKALQVKERPFGIGEEIPGDQDLVDRLSFRVDGEGYSDQSPGSLEDGG